MITVTGVNSDCDLLLESGEKFEVVIDFELAIDGMDSPVSAGNRPGPLRASLRGVQG